MNYEYAMLTNEVYKSWSGMKSSEYKELEGLRKESLRDNMTDKEIALTNIGEIATRDIAKEERPQGLKEKSKSNSLNYNYIDEPKQIEDKEGENSVK